MYTCTSSGKNISFVVRELNIMADMWCAEKPMEPTRSGRPHEPINRVSPVNAWEGEGGREGREGGREEVREGGREGNMKSVGM